MMGATLEAVDTGLRDASFRKRLVIVADNSLIVEAIRIAFRKSGEFNLVGCADGRRTSARTILRAEPDIIMIDDMGQSERTLELVREIRADDAAVPVAMLCIDLGAAWLERSFAAGVTTVISKATRPAALTTLVRETVNGHIVHPSISAGRSLSPVPAPSGEDLPLTGREREILRLVASGSTNCDIARRLWVTEQTVKFHLRNMYRKLGVANRTQASHLAHVRGLVGPVSTFENSRQPALTAVS